MIDRDLIRDKFRAIRPVLNERTRRLRTPHASDVGSGRAIAVAWAVA